MKREKNRLDNRPFGWYSLYMSIDKKNEITVEATRIIAYEGMENLTLSTLAAKVGLSKATLYNYFKSRDEIIEEVIRTGHRAFMKKGFRLNLGGSVEKVLLSASSHWSEIFLSDEHTPWLRVIFSMHLVNDLAEDEYRSITLMLTSQAEVLISSFGLQPLYQRSLTSLFSALLFSRLESTLEGGEINMEDDVRAFASLVEKVRK